MDDQGAVISEPEAANLPNANAVNAGANAHAVAEENVQAARPISLADYNRPDQYYSNKFAIRPPTFRRIDFELKHAYY